MGQIRYSVFHATIQRYYNTGDSMRLALMSDIHGNREALQACMEHAKGQGVDQWAFLGDMVGYGGDPAHVIECIMQASERGAIALCGNHDEMAMHPPAQVKTLGESTALWTHMQLSTEHREWMASLPMTAHLDTVLLVHASADMPEQWRYVHDGRSAGASLDAAQAWPGVRYVLHGHVHEQSLYYRGVNEGMMKFTPQPGIAVPVPRHRHWLAIVGSVGQPRDGNPASMYTVLDTGRAQMTFHRVPYDSAAAAASIRRAGLPDFFAQRLESGT